MFGMRLINRLPYSAMFMSGAATCAFNNKNSVANKTALIGDNAKQLAVSASGACANNGHVDKKIMDISSLSGRGRTCKGLNTIAAGPLRFIVRGKTALRADTTIRVKSPVHFRKRRNKIVDGSRSFTVGEPFSNALVSGHNTN